MYPNATPYYQPQQVYQRPIVPQQVGLKGRPVSSIEEVRASGIDFDGSIFYFPDLANQRIYTKQINIDGTATLNMYELKEIPPEVENRDSSFITREEFNVAIAELRKSLNTPEGQVKTAVPEPQYNF